MKQAGPGSIQHVSPDEELKEVRLRFHKRLRSEQVLLASLTRTLGSASVVAPAIFVDIREFAHRLRGAALVFEFQQLAAAAETVELAATAAAMDEQCESNDPRVLATMQALAMTLAQAVTCMP